MIRFVHVVFAVNDPDVELASLVPPFSPERVKLVALEERDEPGLTKRQLAAAKRAAHGEDEPHDPVENG